MIPKKRSTSDTKEAQAIHFHKNTNLIKYKKILKRKKHQINPYRVAIVS